MLRVTMLLLLIHETWAHPCDAEAMSACPFDGGASLGACLQDPAKHESKTELGAECKEWIALHEVCASNLGSGACGGTSFTDDALLCLQQWTKRTDLTAECAEKVPELVVKERVLDDAAQKKRDQRKRAREKAAAEVRKLNEQNEASTTKKKKTTTKKTSKKSKSMDIDDTEL